MDSVKENLYSRQIGALGLDTSKKLSSLSVCLVGLDSCGIEIAKCLCLLGIKKLYISDDRKLLERNKGRSFAYSNEEKNITIDSATINYLKQLNNYVEISIVKVSVHIIKVVDIFIQTRFTKLLSLSPIQINRICRKHSVKYILGAVIGFSGYVFVDFGMKHVVKDIDGEKLKTCFVSKIINQNDKTLIQLCNSGNEEEFSQGDFFKFENLGIEEKFKIISKNENIITINEKLSPELLKKNTIITQVKEVNNIYHKTLEDVAKSKARYPDVALNVSDYNSAIDFIEDFHMLCKKSNLLNQHEFVFNKILNTRLEFPVIGSIIGSIIAGEIIKLSGKYKPLSQELIVDYSELYSKKTLYKSPKKPKYVDIYGLLPKKTIQYLNRVNVFIVGCGALGCEYLKTLALLNAGTKGSGKITITDMDHIELSNLNRQFLFRGDDIGNSKSITATKKIKEINPDINIDAKELRVGKETEKIFNRRFWERQNFIINALDNVEARQYVDSKCVLYSKPLFEAGTLGNKCNTQVIIPYKTKTYSDTQDPVNKMIPHCTVKNFPFKIEHCVEWSLEFFHKYLYDFMRDLSHLKAGDFRNYIDGFDNENIVYRKLVDIERFTDFLENPTDTSINEFSKFVFESAFVNNIKQLLHNFPENHLKEDGEMFWTGNKLMPIILSDESLIRDFIQCFSKLLSNIIGFKYENTQILDITYSEFVPSDNCKIKVEENDEIKEGMEYQNLSEKIEKIMHKLSQIKVSDILDFNVVEFEKDDDTNGHVEFLTLISNIRAESYNIKPISNLDCKLLAGKIVPALSTTTTLVTAISIMEMLKYITYLEYKSQKIKHKDSFINMGINLYLQSDVQNANKVISGKFNKICGCVCKAIPQSFTTWKKIVISGKKHGIVTMRDLIEYVKDHYSIKYDMINFGDEIIYSKYIENQTNLKFIDIYKKNKIRKYDYLEFDTFSSNDEGIPVLTPKLVYKLDN